MAKKVLITGMSGLIGGLLKEHLLESGGYELTALNRRSVEGITTVQADIADLDAIQPAFEGQEVVVHSRPFTSLRTSARRTGRDNTPEMSSGRTTCSRPRGVPESSV